jgi:lipid-A-disaccharide synthase
VKLAIVAGEASGDLHASEVLRELRSMEPAVEAFGFGGDLLKAEGMEILHHVSELGIVGLFNVLRHLRFFRRIFEQLIGEIARRRPDAVLLVDYPDFNLRVARKCSELGIRVIYYISPQLWAWRKGRVKQIEKYVDEMIVIFPFEEDLYRRHGVPVTYVGHPLIEQLTPIAKSDDAPAGAVTIALMPGSRRMEVASLLPAMIQAVEIIRKERPVQARVLKAPTISKAEILRHVTGDVEVVSSDPRSALASSDLCFSSSGTATLECAILGIPVVVMYVLSGATYAVARHLVRLPDFSLVNIVAGKRVVPELIQREVNGARIAEEARALLRPERYREVREELREVRRRLGEPGASRRAAEAILRSVRSA